MGYTKNQWMTLIIFGIADFCSAVCVSLQAPFYPAEAERKGATATQYGLVFGIFELTVFIVSPIYGKYINKIGPKLMFNLGIFTTATTCIMFGFLDRVDDTNAFIGLSFLIRIVEACGNAGFLTASFSIIAQEFPDNVGATFASLETCFGLGLIVGPTVGGALYEVGGYTLPFLSLGLVLIGAACVTACVLPKRNEGKDLNEGSPGMLAAMKVPSICLYVYAIIATSCSIGFLQATLEPHIRVFDLSPFQLGLMFVLNGATYGIFAPFWGWLSDKVLQPRTVILFGSVITSLSFIMVGPTPGLGVPKSLEIIIVALVLHGIGFGSELVATFSGAHRDAIKNGFPDDLSTYGLISGLWTSTFALGAFIGPSAAGFLFDTIGFEWAAFMVTCMHILVGLSMVIYMVIAHRQQNANGGLYTKLNNVLADNKSETYGFARDHSKDSTYSSYCSCDSDGSEEYVY